MAAEQTFDFIIVGAGSAGCALAHRLSADGARRVLLLEAGPRGHWLSRMPVSFAKLIDNPAANWCFRAEPEEGSGGRSIPVPRGRLLGGSSTINGLVFVRASGSTTTSGRSSATAAGATTTSFRSSGAWSTTRAGRTSGARRAVRCGSAKCRTGARSTRQRARAWTIHIRSRDPREAPAIRFNFLSDALDRRVLVDGVRWARRLMATRAMDGFRDAEIRPGPDVESDDDIVEWIRATAETAFHPVGTCKMGRDPMAVVDDRLRVHGIEGLRIADGSVMPTLVSGNTNAACIMIGEKASQMMLAAAA